MTLAIPQRPSCLVVVIAATACVGCEPLPFCAPWVDPKEQYYVELLDRAPAPDGPATPVSPASCGSIRLVVDTGDVLSMRILDAGVGGNCRWAGPELAIPGVQVVEGPDPGIGVQRDMTPGGLSSTMTVAFPDGCRADLMIAIEGTPIEAGGVAPLSDHILRRTVGNPVDACLPAGVSLHAYNGCMDSWFIKITDSNGRVITKHPEGGV